jgi:hypothetical protein
MDIPDDFLKEFYNSPSNTATAADTATKKRRLIEEEEEDHDWNYTST